MCKQLTVSKHSVLGAKCKNKVCIVKWTLSVLQLKFQVLCKCKKNFIKKPNAFFSSIVFRDKVILKLKNWNVVIQLLKICGSWKDPITETQKNGDKYIWTFHSL